MRGQGEPRKNCGEETDPWVSQLLGGEHRPYKNNHWVRYLTERGGGGPERQKWRESKGGAKLIRLLER